MTSCASAAVAFLFYFLSLDSICKQVFMAVQKAFDTLTDIPKRRAYDSSLEFDDAIPGEHASCLL